MSNVIPMVTTKKIATEYIQKEMRKEFKHFTTKKIKHERIVMQDRRDKAIRPIANYYIK